MPTFQLCRRTPGVSLPGTRTKLREDLGRTLHIQTCGGKYHWENKKSGVGKRERLDTRGVEVSTRLSLVDRSDRTVTQGCESCLCVPFTSCPYQTEVLLPLPTSVLSLCPSFLDYDRPGARTEGRLKNV